MNRNFGRLLLSAQVASLCLSLSISLAASTPAQPESWEAALNGDQLRRMDRVGDKISDIVFDAIEQIRLFSEQNDNYHLDLRVKRRVFDNADILNSWTVVDRFEVSGGIPILSDSAEVAGTPFSSIGYSMGTRSKLEFINIRQVLPAHYPSLPPPQALAEQVSNEDWFRQYLEIQNARNSSTREELIGEWSQSDDEDGRLEFRISDPEDHARYSKLWRLLVFPFRLPLKASSIDRLEDGEIVSYQGEGGLEVGASVGWNPDLSNITSAAQLGLSYRTYVSGAYRISILKESERFVRVKATRTASIGHGMTAGSDYKTTVLDGVIILRDLQREVRIVPFNVSTGQSLSRIFDVGYRYDLENPEARKAYEQAVIGRLGFSDELAIDESGEPRDFAISGVEKIFTRNADSSRSSISQALRIGFIWKRTARATVNAVDAVITLPDGRHHVFTSEVAAGRDWRLLWGTREKLEHNFTISMNLNEYRKNPEKEDAFHLMMEGRIQDTDTSTREMRAYTLEVENSVGKPRIFPVSPKMRNLGRSHFYYQIALDNDLIRKLTEIPEEQMWPILEKAFGVPEGSWSTKMARNFYRLRTSPITLINLPLFVTGFDMEWGSNLMHATKIHRRWRKVRHASEPKERAEALGKMFYDRLYGYQLMRLVRAALDGESISFYASGQNSSFGRIVDQGGSQLRFDNIATRIRREIEFDHEGSRLRDSNPSAVITNLQANVLDFDRVALTFHLEEEPVALFLQLRVDNWWWPFRKEGRCSLLVPNRGEFTKGSNTILLDRNDTESVWYPIAKELLNGNIYAASIAVNTDRIHWGPVAIEKFRLPKKP